ISRGESFARGVKRQGSEAEFVVPDQVPDIAIDGFEGALGINGLLRLNLVRFRFVPGDEKSVREVIATLTMSSVTANAFAVALLDALNKQGMLAGDGRVADVPPVRTGSVATK